MIFKTEFDQRVKIDTDEEYYITTRFRLEGKNHRANGTSINVKVTPLPDSCRECPFWYQPDPCDEGSFEEHWTCFLKPIQDFFEAYKHRPAECPLEVSV